MVNGWGLTRVRNTVDLSDLAQVGITILWSHGPSFLTLGSKVRELQLHFINLDLSLKWESTWPSEGREIRRVTKLGTLWLYHTLIMWPRFGDSWLKGQGIKVKMWGCQCVPSLVTLGPSMPLLGLAWLFFTVCGLSKFTFTKWIWL